MKSYTFPSAGISANQMLTQLGIETKIENGKKYLVLDGVSIPRPPHQHLEEVLQDRFKIKITYTD